MTSCASSRRSRLCQRAGLGREMFACVRNMPRPRERRSTAEFSLRRVPCSAVRQPPSPVGHGGDAVAHLGAAYTGAA